MPRTMRHHRSSPMDIWDCIRAPLRVSLSLSLTLSISTSSLANIYSRTQRLGFLYLRTNTHIQIYRHVLRVCLLISACISRCLALVVPRRRRRTPPEIRSVTPLANFNFPACCETPCSMTPLRRREAASLYFTSIARHPGNGRARFRFHRTNVSRIYLVNNESF